MAGGAHQRGLGESLEAGSGVLDDVHHAILSSPSASPPPPLPPHPPVLVATETSHPVSEPVIAPVIHSHSDPQVRDGLREGGYGPGPR